MKTLMRAVTRVFANPGRFEPSAMPTDPAGIGLPPLAPSPPPAASADGQPNSAPDLNAVALASVQLATLGPRLASVAASMEQQAREQAERASQAAAMMSSLAGDLQGSVADLGATFGDMRGALSTVNRIADATRILSINASIEAARAGAAGQAFAVVVEEMRSLAQQSAQTTQEIDGRWTGIERSVGRVRAVAAAGGEDDAKSPTRNVAAVNQQVNGIASSAHVQLDGAQSLHQLGEQAGHLCEELLLALGKFRFDAHRRAEDAVDQLVPALLATGLDRTALERELSGWLPSHPSFELAYLTDGTGTQIIDNLALADGRVSVAPGGHGRNWSDRPWFREACARSAVSSTDVYRSAATGDYCFTVTCALRSPEGDLLGVLGCDVNFRKMVQA